MVDDKTKLKVYKTKLKVYKVKQINRNVAHTAELSD